ncbi:hypothetical protein FA15DRAFT_518091 [Coprinopsis marcescibilis]|uniref:Nephrocystin 3-like N-terminal domain-containing protein n=1 Tax=Coprinopsis marcescibilis TaxID=230819 RepID=A0A5C3KPX0_COPMA|nr:hypothetical protein FA15DRAFT_518091 [Coprinopsis marcescibilis]
MTFINIRWPWEKKKASGKNKEIRPNDKTMDSVEATTSSRPKTSSGGERLATASSRPQTSSGGESLPLDSSTNAAPPTSQASKMRWPWEGKKASIEDKSGTRSVGERPSGKPTDDGKDTTSSRPQTDANDIKLPPETSANEAATTQVPAPAVVKRSSQGKSLLPARAAPESGSTRPTQGAKRIPEKGFLPSADALLVPTSPASRHDGPGAFAGAHNFEISSSTFLDNYGVITQVSNTYGAKGKDLKVLEKRMAPNALHDGKDRSGAPKCAKGTRCTLIDTALTWLRDTSNRTSVFCVTGPAGSGKSALLQTLVEQCEEEHILLACFFFSAEDVTRNSTDPLIPTLAHQIAQQFEAARKYISNALEKDSTIFDRSLARQAKAYITDPLQDTLSVIRKSDVKYPYAIFIDGVDECRSKHSDQKPEENQAELLQVLESFAVAFKSERIPVKICLAGRWEHALRNAIADDGHLKKSGLLLNHIDLSGPEYDASTDIRSFLERRLAPLAKSIKHKSAEEWPSKADLDTLVDNASGQFIYAATVVKYVDTHRRSPDKSLQTILGWKPGFKQGNKLFPALDALYAGIFQLAQEAANKDGIDVNIVKSIRQLQVLSSDWYVSTVIPFAAVESFLAYDVDEVMTDLMSLVKSYKSTPSSSEPCLALEFHHKTVTDFLEDPVRCGKMFTSTASTCLAVFSLCTKRVEKATQADFQALSRPRMQWKNETDWVLFLSINIWEKCLAQTVSNPGVDELKNLRTTLANLAGGFWDTLQVAFDTLSEADPAWKTKLHKDLEESRSQCLRCKFFEKPVKGEQHVGVSELGKFLDKNLLV